MRGGEPFITGNTDVNNGGIPHTRGDEPHGEGKTDIYDSVSPTRVGMNQILFHLLNAPARIPHPCGDEPSPASSRALPAGYSSHAWG